jgi:small-conductance mechanosensitive channel
VNSSGILDRLIYGNFVRQWLIAAVVFVVVFALLVLLTRLVASRLEKLASRTTNTVDDLVLEIVKGTKSFFLFFLALWAASRALLLSGRGEIYLNRVIGVVALAQGALWTGNAIRFWVQRTLDRRRSAGDLGSVATIRALEIAAKFIAWSLAIVTALGTIGVNIGPLITGLGVGGIAIALAVQNVLGDLLAALAIIFDKPFDVGDSIVVDNVNGTVEHIGLKTTRIRSISGEQVIIANGELLKSRIRNYKRLYERRVAFNIDVTYDTKPDLIERIPGIIRDVVTAQQPVRFDRSHFSAFADSSLRFETVYFVLDADYAKFMNIQQAINLELLRRFKAAGIEFAFPSRTLYLRGDGKENVAVSSRTAEGRVGI